MKVRNYVNEEKRTCVVVISDCEGDVIRKIRKVFRAHFNEDFMFRGNSSFIAEKFIGKAKCAPEDTFDAAVGLELARERAFEKYNAAYDREVDRVVERLEDAVSAVAELYKD